MISVIVPIYNVDDYLSTCISSIINQTYKDLEIILVDDGSTDHSGQICEEFDKLDNRVQVIHKKNEGVSEARNEGLRHAHGEYISFVDADDFIHPQMLEALYNLIKKGDYDFSMILGKTVSRNEIIDMNHSEIGYENTQFLSDTDLVERIFGLSSINTQYQVLWNKLYKKELLEDIWFVRTASEDTHYLNRVYLKTKKAILLEKELYFYVQRSASISHEGVSPYFVDKINSYALCLDDIPKEKPHFRALCLEKLYKVILHTRYYTTKSELKGKCNQISKTIYRKTIKEYLGSDIHAIKKYGLLCFYYFPSLYKLFIWYSNYRAKQR